MLVMNAIKKTHIIWIPSDNGDKMPKNANSLLVIYVNFWFLLQTQILMYQAMHINFVLVTSHLLMLHIYNAPQNYSFMWDMKLTQ
jgi:hypothetical protein